MRNDTKTFDLVRDITLIRQQILNGEIPLDTPEVESLIAFFEELDSQIQVV